MDLKIFAVGFSEKEFNDFCDDNIVYKYHVLDSGAIYVFYKPANITGTKPIEHVETLDRIIKQADVEILSYEIELLEVETKVSDLKEKMSKVGEKEREYKDLEAQVKTHERQILMFKDSIKDKEIKKLNAETRVQDIINKIPKKND